MRWLARLLFIAALAGCSSPPEPTGIAAFVSGDPPGNAAKLARLISQQCFSRAEDVRTFEAALNASGLPVTRTQTADAKHPLEVDAWAWPTGTIYRGELVRGSVWVCSVSTKGSLATDLDHLRSALSQVAGAQPDKAGEWWWNAGLHRFHMDVAMQRDGGLFVNVEDYRLPWWRSILR